MHNAAWHLSCCGAYIPVIHSVRSQYSSNRTSIVKCSIDDKPARRGYLEIQYKYQPHFLSLLLHFCCRWAAQPNSREAGQLERIQKESAVAYFPVLSRNSTWAINEKHAVGVPGEIRMGNLLNVSQRPEPPCWVKNSGLPTLPGYATHEAVRLQAKTNLV
jgi:hypothetical protein